MQLAQSDTLRLNGQFRCVGYAGKIVDTFSKQRLLDAESWEVIYGEAAHAFETRVDDSLVPGQGLWQGEFWGKQVLSAIAAIHYYNDDDLRARLQAAIPGFLASQDANGYLGTYADSSFVQGNTWNVWCRKYTLWGLVELWHLFGDAEILAAAQRFLDHLIGEVGPGAQDIIQTGNFYGLPSTSILLPVLEMFKATGEQRFKDFAIYIVEQWSQHPEGLPDILHKALTDAPVHTWFAQPEEWAKGYEFISCVEGLLELYRIDGNETYLRAVLNIHKQLLQWEQSFIGSISFDDKLVGSRFYKNTFSEICDNIYWNRLHCSLYRLTGEARFADYFEATWYNGLLVAVKSDGCWGLRRQRVSHEHIPATPHCYLKHHQCCTTNLPRGFYQAGDMAVAADAQGIVLALYTPGEGRLRLDNGQAYTVTISGDYPFSDQLSLLITADSGAAETCPIRLRKPVWSTGMQVSIAGHVVELEEVDGWLLLPATAWDIAEPITIQFAGLLRSVEFHQPAGVYSAEEIDAQKALWVKRGYFAEDGVQQLSRLHADDPRDQVPARAVFLGPLALARDKRLEAGDVFATVAAEEWNGALKMQALDAAPAGIARSFDIQLPSGRRLRLCDYPSAGNTWDECSLFSTWIDYTA